MINLYEIQLETKDYEIQRLKTELESAILTDNDLENMQQEHVNSLSLTKEQVS
jgi:hypothetical protein